MIPYLSDSEYDFQLYSNKLVPGITDVDIEVCNCLDVTASPIVGGTVDIGFAVNTSDVLLNVVHDELSVVAEDVLADNKDVNIIDDDTVVFIDVPCEESFIVGKTVLLDMFDSIMVLEGNDRTEDENFIDESVLDAEVAVAVIGIKTLDVEAVGNVTVFDTAKKLKTKFMRYIKYRREIIFYSYFENDFNRLIKVFFTDKVPWLDHRMFYNIINLIIWQLNN